MNENQTQSDSDDLFGDVISIYTTAQGVEDGVLVDVDNLNPTMRAEAGFKFKIYLTSTAYEQCVALTPAAKRAHNDVNGRLWDVLWMLKCAIRGFRGDSTLLYRLHCVVKRVRPSLVTLKAVCGPECPSGEPCITILLPDES